MKRNSSAVFQMSVPAAPATIMPADDSRNDFGTPWKYTTKESAPLTIQFCAVSNVRSASEMLSSLPYAQHPHSVPVLRR